MAILYWDELLIYVFYHAKCEASSTTYLSNYVIVFLPDDGQTAKTRCRKVNKKTYTVQGLFVWIINQYLSTSTTG